MALPWSELPEDLLGLVFGRIFFPVHRARFKAVCHSWRSAMCPSPRKLPWIMLPCGGFLNLSDRVMSRLVSFPEPKTTSCCTNRERFHNRLFSFPRNTRCIGSTDGWIAIDCVAPNLKNKHKYLLHNEFCNTTLPLPDLDAAIGHVSELFNIRKVLLRSTPDDIIAIMTNHRSCPIVLTRRGKGVWFPKWHADPLTRIIDVVFLEDRLYGITKAEDLVFLDIAFDDNGVPMVTGGECVIGKDFHVWSDEEGYDDEGDDINGGDDYNDDHEYDEDDNRSDCEDEYSQDDDDDVIVSADDDDDDNHRDHDEDIDTSDCEDEYKNGDDDDDDDDNDDDGNYDDDADGHNERENDDEFTYDLTKMTDDDITLEAFKCMDVDDSPHEIKPTIYNMWYLIESCGKLLMVRREVHGGDFLFNHKIEVLEADISSAMWVPVEGGLGGRALFISRRFCKSVSAACSNDIQEDAIYFIDTDDVFDMRSKTLSAPRDDSNYSRILRRGDTEELTWVFPPELVS